MGLDKDRAAMLRALRRKSAKHVTPEETQQLARVVIDATPPVDEVKREAAKIREALK